MSDGGGPPAALALAKLSRLKLAAITSDRYRLFQARVLRPTTLAAAVVGPSPVAAAAMPALPASWSVPPPPPPSAGLTLRGRLTAGDDGPGPS